MHCLHDAGEERLGDPVAIVAPASQQQVFELIERGHDGNLQAQEDLHQDLEESKHEVLPGRPHLEFELREAIREEAGQLRLVSEKRCPGEPLIDVPAHEAGGIVRLRALDVVAEQLERPIRLDAALAQALNNGRGMKPRRVVRRAFRVQRL